MLGCSPRCAVAAAALILLCTVSGSAAQPAPFRLLGSPYPAPSLGPNCSATLLAYSSSLQPPQLLLLSSLQGLAARTCPRLFRVGDGSPADMQRAFASDFPAFGSSLDLSIASDFTALLLAVREFELARGYALCDMRQAGGCSAATSYCAAADACVVVDVSDEAPVQQALRIPRVFDARNASVDDVIALFPLQRGSAWSCSVAVLQQPAKLPYLVDVAVFGRAVRLKRARFAAAHA